MVNVHLVSPKGRTFGICIRCGIKKARHKIIKPGNPGETEDLCCKCHISSGGIPVGWHPDCMAAYKKKKADL